MSSKNKEIRVTYTVMGGYIVSMQTKLASFLSDLKSTREIRNNNWLYDDYNEEPKTGKITAIKFNKLTGELESVSIDESLL